MASKDLIILPSYWRAEFLYLCLEHIYAAEDSSDCQISVYEDQKVGDKERFEKEIKDVQTVLAYWKRGLGDRLHTIIRNPNNFYGNSFNILEAYKKAYTEDWRYVFLIEDDVLITPDFFKWHRAVQETENFFCTIAGKTERNPCPQTEHAGTYFMSDCYASLGVCWRRENLDWVSEHANIGYYNNPAIHILNRFKQSKYGLFAMEQDGLVMRVMEQRLVDAAWSCKNRAPHVGVFGYHRGIDSEQMFDGTLAERIEKYRIAVSDQDWINKVAAFQTDIQAYQEN